jgi:PST family polysaccharide transporter
MAILRNVSWTGTGQVVRQSIQFVLGIALARLLAPADFGLLALVTVFTGFAAMFSDFGMSSAVIYRQEASTAELDFAFWLNIAVGLLAMSLCLAAAPLVGSFYGDLRVIPLMRAVALTFIIGSFGVLPHSLLQKALRFRALAFVDISTATAAGTIAVIMAFRGFGVWSLVAQAFATTLISAVLKWMLVRWRPGFRFRWRDGAALWRFGANLLGFNAVNYWCRNGDNLLIGKFCGAVQLGFYSRAYSLMLLPVSQVHSVLSAVMFPTLAAMQHSTEAFRRTYLLACQAIALFAFPIMLGLIVEADDFIYVLWGPRWVGVVPIIRVLAIAGIGNAVSTTVGWIYTATGRTDLMFRWVLIAAPILLASFAVGIRGGALGVAIAYTVALYCVLWYPMWVIPGRLIGLSFASAMRNLVRPLIAAGFAAGSMLAIRLSAQSLTISAPARLLILTMIGSILYAIAATQLKIPAAQLVGVRLLTFLKREQAKKLWKGCPQYSIVEVRTAGASCPKSSPTDEAEKHEPSN